MIVKNLKRKKKYQYLVMLNPTSEDVTKVRKTAMFSKDFILVRKALSISNYTLSKITAIVST